VGCEGIFTVSEFAPIDWQAFQKQTPYPQEAFAFVQQGLAHAVRLVHEQDESEMIEMGEERHVSGQQLCEGLREFAVNRYGLLAKAVLAKWGVHATDDFGRIVFAMIDAGLMRRSEDDLFEHFVGVYAFSDAFPAPPALPAPSATAAGPDVCVQTLTPRSPGAMSPGAGSESNN
jgi:uncharacterized repeat protein (TIGR04138 family)